MRSILHPIYDSDEVLAQHMTWHSFFQNYAAFDPAALALSGLQGEDARRDPISWQAARQYAYRTRLVKNYESLNASLTHFGLRLALHDNLMRRVYLGYITQHPTRALRVYLLQKPPDVAKRYWSEKSAAFPFWVSLVNYGLCATFGLSLIFLPWSVTQARSLVMVVVRMGIVSTLPHIAGAPDLVNLNDMCIVWPAAFYLGLPLVLALLIAWKRASPPLIQKKLVANSFVWPPTS
jgi:hypothetical protein